MGRKLFVSNIDFDVTQDQLKEMFEGVGPAVSVVMALDRETKRSKGFAFVEMESDELAKTAIEKLNNKAINGRPMKVCEDRGKQGSGGGGAEAGAEGEEGGAPRQREFLPPMQRINLFKRKRKLDPFIEDPSRTVDYKDVTMLSRFVSERGKILSRRFTGLNAYNQRRVARAIKQAQSLGLMRTDG